MELDYHLNVNAQAASKFVKCRKKLENFQKIPEKIGIAGHYSVGHPSPNFDICTKKL